MIFVKGRKENLKWRILYIFFIHAQIERNGNPLLNLQIVHMKNVQSRLFVILLKI